MRPGLCLTTLLLVSLGVGPACSAEPTPEPAKTEASPPSVKTDPRYKASLSATLVEVQKGERIYGKLGVATAWPGPATVGLRGARGICTGVLVTSKAVLTARHCICEGMADEVLFGLEMANPTAVVPVEKPIPITNDCAKPYKGTDLGLLILKIATAQVPAVVQAQAGTTTYTSLRAIGYGLTEQGQAGRALFTDIPVVSPSCAGKVATHDDEVYYNCARGKELVAGRFQEPNAPDTCRGDSGGPMFRRTSNGEFRLAAITSRATGQAGAARCGDGGIYALLDDTTIKWMNDNGVKVTVAP